ncbi:uncharacterized protein TNIN_336821 [Trichonephila inaurata madagascariensis]|uniref:Uncharacterized protein n=1 Tax=Trichonephila inaurata madagascariensis TaxID=2747483 RepID=A0A8X7BM85_9ARAC|nr:uncharacterized protein TNIN_336821 [Trichonephila inaurata madagascariensis]
MVANRVAGVRPTTGRVRRVPPSHWSKARCYRVYALVDASEGWTFYDNFLPWNLTFCPGGGQPEQAEQTYANYRHSNLCGDPDFWVQEVREW